MAAAPALDLTAPLVVGFGITSRAVVAALQARSFIATVLEDRPNDELRRCAADLGVQLIETPDAAELAAALETASVLLPSPGIPDHHPVFAAARAAGVPVASEFDLAQSWDTRPVATITGTNGKTTVTMMVSDALDRSGIPAAAVGNTDVPYVDALDDSATNVFVVEASSFRLAHSGHFSPQVSAWLNFAPDHLDAHATLDAYELAKASVWSKQGPSDVAVANFDDPVVRRHAQLIDGPKVTYFSIEAGSTINGVNIDWRLETINGRSMLVGPDGPLVGVDELARHQPHDVANALATAAIACGVGATLEGVAETLRTFGGLPHRLEFLGTWNDVHWYDDSKATVPHATVAAVGGFESVVLIAGGSPKGLSFEPLGETVPPVRAVVAIGQAADQIAEAFAGRATVVMARENMAEAIDRATELARPGDAVVLSPACASFDWYKNYVARGEDFAQQVRAKFGSHPAEIT